MARCSCLCDVFSASLQWAVAHTQRDRCDRQPTVDTGSFYLRIWINNNRYDAISSRCHMWASFNGTSPVISSDLSALFQLFTSSQYHPYQKVAYSMCHCNGQWKKRSEETQTLRAGCSKAERGGQNLISWRWSLPLPTNPVWWGSMHTSSSYRGNRPTNLQTHAARPLQTRPQTGPITIHCTAKLKPNFDYNDFLVTSSSDELAGKLRGSYGLVANFLPARVPARKSRGSRTRRTISTC